MKEAEAEIGKIGLGVPANLVQAQRDYFGAHTYELTAAKGTFHMEWAKG
jgi:6-phosphogluconate dehydrogenase